jgi:hypothetical protein
MIEYTNKEGAITAVKTFDGHQLDKNHTFRVTLYDDLQKYDNVSDEYTPPKIEPLDTKPKVMCVCVCVCVCARARASERLTNHCDLET